MSASAEIAPNECYDYYAQRYVNAELQRVGPALDAATEGLSLNAHPELTSATLPLITPKCGGGEQFYQEFNYTFSPIDVSGYAAGVVLGGLPYAAVEIRQRRINDSTILDGKMTTEILGRDTVTVYNKDPELEFPEVSVRFPGLMTITKYPPRDLADRVASLPAPTVSLARDGQLTLPKLKAAYQEQSSRVFWLQTAARARKGRGEI